MHNKQIKYKVLNYIYVVCTVCMYVQIFMHNYVSYTSGVGGNPKP